MSISTSNLRPITPPTSYSLAELRRTGHAPLRNLPPISYAQSLQTLPSIRSALNSLISSDSLIGKLTIIAKKSWITINTNWDIAALCVSALALSYLLWPSVTLNLIQLTKEVAIGFIAGFTISHYTSSSNGSIWDKMQNLPAPANIALSTAATFLSPLVPVVGGFIAGNHVRCKLN